MTEWEFSVYHLAKELGMLAEDLCARMTMTEYMGWNKYFKKLSEKTNSGDGNSQSKNLLSGNVSDLVGALT